MYVSHLVKIDPVIHEKKISTDDAKRNGQETTHDEYEPL